MVAWFIIMIIKEIYDIMHVKNHLGRYGLAKKASQIYLAY